MHVHAQSVWFDACNMSKRFFKVVGHKEFFKSPDWSYKKLYVQYIYYQKALTCPYNRMNLKKWG